MSSLPEPAESQARQSIFNPMHANVQHTSIAEAVGGAFDIWVYLSCLNVFGNVRCVRLNMFETQPDLCKHPAVAMHFFAFGRLLLQLQVTSARLLVSPGRATNLRA